MIQSEKKYYAFIVMLGVLLLVVFFLSLILGGVPIPLIDAIHIIFSPNTSSTSTSLAQGQLIITELRLPRAMLALLVGALLACSGTAMQGLFRNPLADPSLIGVTAGASLGASLMIFFSVALSHSIYSHTAYLSLTSIGACTGGACAVLIVYRIATRAGFTSVTTMLLTGIAMTALASSITNLLEYFSDSVTLRNLSLWRMGNLESATFLRVIVALILFITCLSTLWLKSHALNAFLLGESEARHLGISVDKTKRLLIFVVAIATGISVSLAGTIVFVGLIVPHIMRIFVGPNHHRLLPATALGGAILLCSADIVARTVLAPIELPVGLVIAFIGAPFFIALLRRNFSYGF